MNYKELKRYVEQLQGEWRRILDSKIIDKQRAQVVSGDNSELLEIIRGTILVSSRDPPITFDEIIKEHEKKLGVQLPRPPPPQVGGWRKFAREVLSKLPKKWELPY